MQSSNPLTEVLKIGEIKTKNTFLLRLGVLPPHRHKQKRGREGRGRSCHYDPLSKVVLNTQSVVDRLLDITVVKYRYYASPSPLLWRTGMTSYTGPFVNSVISLLCVCVCVCVCVKTL